MIVHLVTDWRRLTGARADTDEGRRCVLAQIRHAVDAGIDAVQVRERELEAGALASLVADCVALTRRTRTRIVVNDRLDIALACGADGVHLRGDSFPVSAARAIVPPGFLIGRSVHRVEEAVAAAGADYLVAGTVWPSASKPAGHLLLGVRGLSTIAQAVGIPVLAIGGVTVSRAREAVAAGAAGIAAIGLFMADDESSCRAAPLAAVVGALRAGTVDLQGARGGE